MQKLADIIFQDNQFRLSGDLCFANVMTIYRKSLTNLSNCHALDFDFSQVKSSDSAGLALVLEWWNYAKLHNKTIQFSCLSADLMSIAKAAGVDQLLIG